MLTIPKPYASNPCHMFLDSDERKFLGQIDAMVRQAGARHMRAAYLALLAPAKAAHHADPIESMLDGQSSEHRLALLHEAAVRGLASACYALAGMHAFGNRAFRDAPRAAFWYGLLTDRDINWMLANLLFAGDESARDSALKLQSLACTSLASLYSRRGELGHEPERALALYRRASELGSAAAGWHVFSLIKNGEAADVGEREIAEALAQLEASARGGYPLAESLYEDYEGELIWSEGDARLWWLRQMRNSGPYARAALIIDLLASDDYLRDYDEASRLIDEMNASGDVEAMKLVAPVAADCRRPALAQWGIRFLERMADMDEFCHHHRIRRLLMGDEGDAGADLAVVLLESAVCVGRLREDVRRADLALLADVRAGFHGERHAEQSRVPSLLEAAVHLGDARCAKNLGGAYEYGHFGLAQSPALAAEWYLKAAEMGQEDALLCHARLVASGRIGDNGAQPLEVFHTPSP